MKHSKAVALACGLTALLGTACFAPRAHSTTAPVLDPGAAAGATPAASNTLAASMPSLEDWFQKPAPTDPVLYPGGEGVHDAPTPGFSVEGQPGNHDVQPTETGRMHLLELYQGAIDEREALELELAGVQGALDRAYAELDSKNLELEQRAGVQSQLEAERDALQAQNAELAGRLATAQIRRLEAEKMLLEAKIEMAQMVPTDRLAPKEGRP